MDESIKDPRIQAAGVNWIKEELKRNGAESSRKPFTIV